MDIKDLFKKHVGVQKNKKTYYISFFPIFLSDRKAKQAPFVGR